MSRVFPTMLLLCSVLAGAASADTIHIPRHPRVVQDVDVARYMGRWYEIARIPMKFQKDCDCCATATYTLRDDGRIAVLNECLQADGTRKTFAAEAEVADARTHARLKLTPFKVLGIGFVKADYWIIGLDADYAWAVVGHPDRKYGWILSRTPALDPAVRAEIDALLVRQGYDPAVFVDTEQGED
jgi:apolipoprotein D and lipocalin family protein